MEKNDLCFGVISDTHMGEIGRGAGAYSTHARLAKVLQWYNSQSNAEALVVTGDISDCGAQAQFDLFKSTWEENKGRLQLIAVMGNHDAYPADKNAAADSFESATGQRANAHYVIKGYHFIAITGGSGDFISDSEPRGGAIASGRTVTPGETQNSCPAVPQSTMDWLRERITYAKAQSPGRPVFIFLHWPVQNTFYVSDEWWTSNFGSDPLTGWFKDDPEVVIFGGHIHTPNSDPRSIWQGGFTSVNVPSTNYMEMEKGYLGDGDGASCSSWPKIAGNASGQGLIVSVKGSKVTIENYDFDLSQGPRDISGVERIPQTWEFDVAHPSEFPYTEARRGAQKTVPVFDTGASGAAISGKITLKSVGSASVEVEFPQAVIPPPNAGNEAVHSYCFDFINKKTGNTDRSVRQWSDFMLTPRLQKPFYTQIIGGLAPGTEYELRISAYGSFQQRSSQNLSVVFTTAGGAGSSP